MGALRFSSIFSTLCFLSSQRFFVGYIEFFLTRRKIFLCLVASTLTQRVSTIYIVVAGVLFVGHNACLPHSLHLLNFHTFYALIFSVSQLLVQSGKFISCCLLHFWGFVLYMRVCCWSTYCVNLSEERPQLYGFIHCFLCCGFIHSFRVDSSTLITGDLSPLFLCGFVHCGF